MEFSLDAYSPAGTEATERKHQRLFEAWVQAAGEGSWKLAQVPVVPKKFQGGTVACRSLPFADRRIHGRVHYILRVPGLECDSDSLHIKFKPTSENYGSLVDDIMPAIIRAVSLKEMTLGDRQFIAVEIPPDGIATVGGKRACGVNIHPIFFMSEETALYELGFRPAEVAERLQGIAEEVRLMAGGVFVIGSRQLMPFDQAVALAKAMESALKAKPASSFRLARLFGLFSKDRS